jgi:hypothetical protein
MPGAKGYLGSTTGLAVCLAAAALGLHPLVYHLNYVLLAIAYLLLIVCPLMHALHRGHGRHGERGSKKVS